MSQKLQPAPVPRRHHKKSFTGCQNCKDRKVKCDETHPLCKNCAKHFINMDRCFFEPDIEPEENIRDATKLSTVAAFYQVDPAHGTPKRGLRPKTSRVRPAYESMTIAAVVSSRDRHKCLSEWHDPSLPMTIGGGQMDPFKTHPETKAPDVDVLLSHCRPPVVVSPASSCGIHMLGCLTNVLGSTDLSTFVLRNFLYFTTCPMVKLWWPLIQSDSLLFHVALLLSSLSLEESRNPKEGNRARHLLGGWNSRQIQAECIRQLSDRVQDEVLGTSDQTIVAVSNLAAIEHERGNMKMVQMHMDGLRRMVSMRGGLNSIRSTTPLAANIAFWMSMVAMNEPQFLPTEFVGYEEPIIDELEGSNLFQFGIFTPEGTPHDLSDIALPYYDPDKPEERPQTVTPHDTYLSFVDPADFSEQPQVSLRLSASTEDVDSPLLPVCSTSCHLSPDLHIDFITFGLPSSYAQLLHSIQHLSQRFATIVDYNSSTSSETTISVFSELCLLLQRLLRLPAADAISESCRFAAAIQLISPLWGYYPDCTLVMNALLHELTVSLKSLLSFSSHSASSTAASSPFLLPFSELGTPGTAAMGVDIKYLLLWLFSVGAAEADRRMPEHDWFVGHLVVIVSELGIEAWEGPAGLRSVLVKFVWHDIFCEGPLREVWEEVKERRELLRLLERETD